MKWAEIVVKTKRENEDFVSHILYEAGAQGLAIEDARDIIELSQEPDSWDFFDINIKDLDHDNIYIKSYFPQDGKLDHVIKFIRENIEIDSLTGKGEIGKVYENLVDEDDWAESWKTYYKTTSVGKNIIIKPNWETYDNEEGKILIDMDPGMAFGTGTHETTILCLEALETYILPDIKVFDIGCGSGILSIAAAKLGASRVIGVDLDPTAIKVSEENIKMNQVEDRIDIKLGNLLEVVDEKSDLIVANIIAEVIAEMTSDIANHLNEDGIFIASGIILSKLNLVREALETNNFKILETNKMNEWACIIAKK